MGEVFQPRLKTFPVFCEPEVGRGSPVTIDTIQW